MFIGSLPSIRHGADDIENTAPIVVFLKMFTTESLPMDVLLLRDNCGNVFTESLSINCHIRHNTYELVTADFLTVLASNYNLFDVS
jgi:hypothetical protein